MVLSRVKPKTSAASSLRRLISGRSIVVAPGVFSPIVAQLAERAGFEAIESDIILIARTDARAVEGFDSAVERANAYLKAGAEVIFPEALESGDEFREFRKKVRAPLLANMTEFGKTPYLTAAEFEEMGYNIVIFPMTPFRAMLKSVKSTLEALKRTGTQKGILKDLMTRGEIYEVIDYYRYEEADKRAMETARKLDKADTA